MDIKPRALPIIKEEAARNGLTLDQLIEDDRRGRVTSVRHYAMWRAKKETGRTWLEIARLFKRDHTTVIYAYRKMEALPEDRRSVFPTMTRVQTRMDHPDYGKKIEGRPCRRGHTTRYLSTGRCVECKCAADRRRDRRLQKAEFYAEAAE
jgi:hypothetical protein